MLGALREELAAGGLRHDDLHRFCRFESLFVRKSSSLSPVIEEFPQLERNSRAVQPLKHSWQGWQRASSRNKDQPQKQKQLAPPIGSNLPKPSSHCSLWVTHYPLTCRKPPPPKIRAMMIVSNYLTEPN